MELIYKQKFKKIDPGLVEFLTLSDLIYDYAYKIIYFL